MHLQASIGSFFLFWESENCDKACTLILAEITLSIKLSLPSALSPAMI